MKRIKRNKTYILIILLLFFPFFIFGHEQLQHPNVEHPLIFKVVKELNFEKSIKDVAFGITVKDTVFYPKIIVFDDEICCYNEKDKLLWSHKETSETFMHLSPYLSTNGKFILISVYYRPVGLAKDEPVISYFQKIKIFNESGKQIWDTIYSISDGGKLAAISNKGFFVIMDIGYAALDFFDSLCKKVNEAKLREDWNWLRTLGVSFSDNGERLAAFCTEPTDSANNATVILFDKNGTELLRKYLRNISDISVSPEGDFLLTICEAGRRGTKDWRKYAILFNSKGKIVVEHEIPIGANTYFKFSKDDNYAVLGNGFSIVLFRVKEGTLLWTKTLQDIITPLPDPAPERLIPIDVSNNGCVAVATNDEKQVAIHIVNQEGNLLQNYIVDDSNCYGLKFSPDSKKLFSIMRNKIIEFSLEGK